MIKVEFLNVREIRMGSPYSLCEVRLSGDWVPDLPDWDWQDIMAEREENGLLALVRWDTPGNRPGFRIYIINSTNRSIHVSPRFPGCCKKLYWIKEDQIGWEAFPDLEGEYRIVPSDGTTGEK